MAVKLLIEVGTAGQGRDCTSLAFIDGPGEHPDTVTLANGNRVAPGAQALLSEFGIPVVGERLAMLPQGEYEALVAKAERVAPEIPPWAAAERALDAAVASGKITDWSFNKWGDRCAYYTRHVSATGIGETRCCGEAPTREAAAAAAVAFLATLPEPKPALPDPKRMTGGDCALELQSRGVKDMKREIQHKWHPYWLGVEFSNGKEFVADGEWTVLHFLREAVRLARELDGEAKGGAS